MVKEKILIPIQKYAKYNRKMKKMKLRKSYSNFKIKLVDGIGKGMLLKQFTKNTYELRSYYEEKESVINGDIL